jgi:hypothetical protein
LNSAFGSPPPPATASTLPGTHQSIAEMLLALHPQSNVLAQANTILVKITFYLTNIIPFYYFMEIKILLPVFNPTIYTSLYLFILVLHSKKLIK